MTGFRAKFARTLRRSACVGCTWRKKKKRYDVKEDENAGKEHISRSLSADVVEVICHDGQAEIGATSEPCAFLQEYLAAFTEIGTYFVSGIPEQESSLEGRVISRCLAKSALRSALADELTAAQMDPQMSRPASFASDAIAISLNGENMAPHGAAAEHSHVEPLSCEQEADDFFSI